MTAIASYFAQVGIGLDKSAIGKVDNYLNQVERKLQRFQGNISRKSSLGLRFNVDQKRLNTNIQTALKSATRSGLTAIDISKFNFKAGSLVSAINREFKLATQANRGVKIDARLSEASLRNMRSQIQGYMKGITISPNINANITSRQRARVGGSDQRGRGYSSGGTDVIRRRDPTSSRKMSPYYNPLMVGGAAGAVLRYGAYALPMYAGAIGFNSVSNKAQTLQGQGLMMKVSTQDAAEAARQMEYLSKLGDYLGTTTETMAPFYGQLMAGAKGTSMEAGLQSGFKQFLEYASVVGLDDEQKKGSLRAVSQMLAKRTVMSEELRQQLAEHGMPMAVQIMADAVAGGDIAKLQKMMERGEVNSLEALPKFFEKLGELAAPFMEDYFKTISYNKGKLSKISEDWFKSFMSAGGESGVAGIYSTLAEFNMALKGSSEVAGNLFKGATEWLNVGILAFRDLSLWMTGRDIGIENIFETYLGKFDMEIWTEMGSTLNKILDAVTQIARLAGVIYTALKDIGVIADLWASAKGLVKTAGNAADLVGAIVSPELGAVARLGMRRRAEVEAERLVRTEEANGKVYSPAERKARYDELMNTALESLTKDFNSKSGFSKWWATSSNELFAFDSLMSPFEAPFGKGKSGVNVPLERILANPDVYPEQYAKVQDMLSKPPHPLNSSEWWNTRRQVDAHEANQRGLGYFNSVIGGSSGGYSMFGAKAPSSGDLTSPLVVDSFLGMASKITETGNNILSILNQGKSGTRQTGTTIENMSISIVIEDPVDQEKLADYVVNEFSNQFAQQMDTAMTGYHSALT